MPWCTNHRVLVNLRLAVENGTSGIGWIGRMDRVAGLGKAAMWASWYTLGAANSSASINRGLEWGGWVLASMVSELVYWSACLGHHRMIVRFCLHVLRHSYYTLPGGREKGQMEKGERGKWKREGAPL